MLFVFVFFFFKQKTEYEMRISDWSSYVCSSDLTPVRRCGDAGTRAGGARLPDLTAAGRFAERLFRKRQRGFERLVGGNRNIGMDPDVLPVGSRDRVDRPFLWQARSEEHTSELQSLMRISYAVFCLKKKT